MEEEENTACGVRRDGLQWNDKRSRRQEKVSMKYDEYRDELVFRAGNGAKIFVLDDFQSK